MSRVEFENSVVCHFFFFIIFYTNINKMIILYLFISNKKWARPPPHILLGWTANKIRVSILKKNNLITNSLKFVY